MILEYYLNENKFKDILIDIMNSSNSIAIHVRRGDYLLPPHNKVFAGICTKEYYQKAINIMKQKLDNPKFFFFSNDMEWVKANIQLEDVDSYYIDWNIK